MAAPTLTRGRLRRLAEVRPGSGRVLSVFLDLDPSEFATGPARSTAIASVVADASRRVEECRNLDHDEHKALRADVERVREALQAPDLAGERTRGVAVFACAPAGLFEVVRVPHRLASRTVIDLTPHVAPLVSLGESERWCVLLTTRRDARVLMGDERWFEDVETIDGAPGIPPDDPLPQHTTDHIAEQHLKAVADRLRHLHEEQPFDHLLVGSPDALANQVVQALHPYVRDRLCGRIHVDVEHATAEQVREAATPVIEEEQRKRERAMLDRFAQEAGRGGRAAAGLAATLEALNEHRVEILLFEQGFRAGGAVEKQSGMLLVDGGAVPVDSPEIEGRNDILEPAIERAIEQAADVVVVRRFPDLGAHGGIGALLRF